MQDPLPDVLARMVALWHGEDVDPASVFASGCVLNDGEATYQPEDVLPWVRKLRRAFPDIHFEVVASFAADARYVILFRVSGTHTGTFETAIGTAPPTGNAVTAHGIEVFEIRDERVVAVWEAWDWRSLYASLGARIA
jgi:predicted ester cyclase